MTDYLCITCVLFSFHLPFKIHHLPYLFIHPHLEFTDPVVRVVFKISSCAVAALRGVRLPSVKGKLQALHITCTAPQPGGDEALIVSVPFVFNI